jgi:hypothetical protein
MGSIRLDPNIISNYSEEGRRPEYEAGRVLSTILVSHYSVSVFQDLLFCSSMTLMAYRLSSHLSYTAAIVLLQFYPCAKSSRMKYMHALAM